MFAFIHPCFSWYLRCQICKIGVASSPVQKHSCFGNSSWEGTMDSWCSFIPQVLPGSHVDIIYIYMLYIYIYIWCIYIYKGFISTSILLHRQPFQSLSKGWGRCGCFRPGGSFHNQKLAVARLQWSYVLQNIAACIGKPQFTYIYIYLQVRKYYMYMYIYIYMHTYTSYTHMYSVLAMCIHMIHIIYTSYNCVYSRN